MRPILKWTGGKRQFVVDIKKYMQPGQRLIEPFVGGGALFFACDGPAIINDMNCELINFYKVVRDKPLELVKWVRTWPQDKETYYEIRDNDRFSDFETQDSFTRAGRFLYLNKCAFNGMWRENSKGFHNVPWNQKRNSGFPSDADMLAASGRLKQANITCGDFADACAEASVGDFVYFDPPYTTSTFTSYAKSGFDHEDLKRLADLALTLSNIKVNVCVSNLGAPEILALFPEPPFKVEHLKGKRHIFAANPKSRVEVDEVLIVNVKR